MNVGQNTTKMVCRVLAIWSLLSILTLCGVTHLYWGMSARYEKARFENIMLRNELSEGLNCKPPMRRT